MKYLKNILFAGTIIVFVLTGCDQEQTATLSKQNQMALTGMKEAYENASIANASLRIAVQAGISNDIHKYDSVFHYCKDNFEIEHNKYEQNGPHDDHFHDAQGIHGMNSMMSNHHQWVDGHHKSDHDLMGGLISDHNSITH